MKELKYINKYFSKYKWRLLIGVLITVFGKLLALRIPPLVSNSLNSVEEYLKAKEDHLPKVALEQLLLEVETQLLINVLIIIGVAVLSGFFTFLMRQTIIVTSRLIEFDLKNEIYQQYQRLSLNFYKKKQNR